MKSYLELLKDIRDNGHDHPDRTGVGRRSIFGRQIRFNLKDGFPLVTTRKIFFRGMKEELFWFISGQTDNRILNASKVHIWDKWAVSENTVDKFIKLLLSKVENSEDRKDLEENPVLLDQIRNEHMSVVGSIGPLYGFNWRHADRQEEPQLITMMKDLVDINDIPSDKVEAFKQAYQKYVFVKKMNNPEESVISETKFIQKTYSTKVDQLGELVAELKNNPFSSRLVVNSWIPEYIPDPKLSPDMNVLFGRGALAPCHVMFQCFVQPPETEGGKQRLNLMMTQR
jgi:thymidylate synthase